MAPPPRLARSAGPVPAGPAPDRARLHEAALRHLARFATTEAGLVRVLDRRIDRWVRVAAAESEMAEDAASGARRAAREVAAALVRSGVVDDAAFAQTRARSLLRAGRSRRAVGAHLAAKGIAPEVAHAALPADPEQELAAALGYARRRRLGPFRVDREADPETRRRELGAMARAGFPQEVAQQALRMEPGDALARILAMKQAR